GRLAATIAPPRASASSCLGGHRLLVRIDLRRHNRGRRAERKRHVDLLLRIDAALDICLLGNVGPLVDHFHLAGGANPNEQMGLIVDGRGFVIADVDHGRAPSALLTSVCRWRPHSCDRPGIGFARLPCCCGSSWEPELVCRACELLRQAYFLETQCPARTGRSALLAVASIARGGEVLQANQL